MKNQKRIKILRLYIVSDTIVFISIALGIFFYSTQRVNAISIPSFNTPFPSTLDLGKFNNSNINIINYKEINAFIGESQSVPLVFSSTIDKSTSLPTFVTIQNNSFVINPSKNDFGQYHFSYNISNLSVKSQISYSLNIKNHDVDFTALQNKIVNIIGDRKNDFAVFLYDFHRNQTITINADAKFGPASICKIPYAMMVMKDVESGKYKLSDTFPVKNSLKFGTTDDISIQPQGTALSIETYMKEMLSESSNTALYHLDNFLGGEDVVNSRIINQLGLSDFFMNPQETTAANVGKAFKDIYSTTTISRPSSDYIINLLKNAEPSLKEGLALGLPQDQNVTFANKLGFLATDQDSAYEDAGIFWGQKTDYALVVLDIRIDWDSARTYLTNISDAVYTTLN